jgi:hypothetical protein
VNTVIRLLMMDSSLSETCTVLYQNKVEKWCILLAFIIRIVLYCVGVLVTSVLVFTVFCIVCTVFFVLFRLCIFIPICFVCTGVRTAATE